MLHTNIHNVYHTCSNITLPIGYIPIYILITYRLHLGYLYFAFARDTYGLRTELHMGHIQITYNLNTSYKYCICYVWYIHTAIKSVSRLYSSTLLAGCPLQGPSVDVPPSGAVTSIFLYAAGCSTSRFQEEKACRLPYRRCCDIGVQNYV